MQKRRREILAEMQNNKELQMVKGKEKEFQAAADERFAAEGLPSLVDGGKLIVKSLFQFGSSIVKRGSPPRRSKNSKHKMPDDEIRGD